MRDERHQRGSSSRWRPVGRGVVALVGRHALGHFADRLGLGSDRRGSLGPSTRPVLPPVCTLPRQSPRCAPRFGRHSTATTATGPVYLDVDASFVEVHSENKPEAAPPTSMASVSTRPSGSPMPLVRRSPACCDPATPAPTPLPTTSLCSRRRSPSCPESIVVVIAKVTMRTFVCREVVGRTPMPSFVRRSASTSSPERHQLLPRRHRSDRHVPHLGA